MKVSGDRILFQLLYRRKNLEERQGANITVCGTTYNEKERAPLFVSSIQCLNPREIIITDDLSTDGTDKKL